MFEIDGRVQGVRGWRGLVVGIATPATPRNTHSGMLSHRHPGVGETILARRLERVFARLNENEANTKAAPR